MERVKDREKAKPYRHSIQAFFLIFTVVIFITAMPNKEFIVVVLGLILLITLIFGTGFCGWICPLGSLFQLVRKLGTKIESIFFIKPLTKRIKRWTKNNRVFVDRLDRYGRYFKYVFFLWILQAALVSLASVTQGYGFIVMNILYVTVLATGLFVDRAWCRYFCPVGVVIGLVGRFSPTRVTRDELTCIDCNLCNRKCQMKVDVAHAKRVEHLDCNSCLTCVDVCPVGALDLRIDLPAHKGAIKEQVNAHESI